MALQVYSTITDKGARQKFLCNFETMGSGKGQNALKWVSQFQKSLSHSNSTEVASVEDMLTRPKILEHLGVRMSDFPSVERALEVGPLSCTTYVCAGAFVGLANVCMHHHMGGG